MVSKIIYISVLYHLSNNYSFSFIVINEVFKIHFDQIKPLFCLFFLFAMLIPYSIFEFSVQYCIPTSSSCEQYSSSFDFPPHIIIYDVKIIYKFIEVEDVDLVESADWIESWSRILKMKQLLLQLYMALWFDLVLLLLFYQKA